MSEHIIVLSTCPSDEVATQLANGLVDSQLVACVNIVPALRSIYVWQGAKQQDTESLMIIKTRRACYPDVESYIRKHHPYELPEIVAVPIDAGLPEYLSWINKQTRVL